MVRTYSGLLILLLALVPIQPASAQVDEPHVWTPDRPDAWTPQSVTEGRILPRGSVQIGARYLMTDMSGQGFGTDSLTVSQVFNLFGFDVTPSDQIIHSFALDILYGLTDKVTLSARGTFSEKTMDHLAMVEGQANRFLFYQTEASGLQDIKVSGLYDVLSAGPIRFHLQGGLSIPIGSIDSEDETPISDFQPTQLPYSQQLGSGTFDLLPGFTFNIQNQKASLGLQGTAVLRLGENDRGWTLGDRYEGYLWAGYKASDWVSVTLGTRYSSWGNVEGFDEDLDPNESPAHNTLTQGGWRVDLPLGMNFVMPGGPFEGHRLGFEFLIPIHQDLDGPQLRHDWSLVAGWSMDLAF